MTAVEPIHPPAAQAGGTRLEVAIRPGVVFPDWSAVRSEPARAALEAIFQGFGAEACWDGYGAEDDRVRRAILEGYAGLGRAPRPAELAERTGLAPAALTAVLRNLKKRDLVVLDEAGERVTGAYPLTDRASEHVVDLGERRVHAMCAIDALGTGAMYRRDVVIESSCRACGDPIRVETREDGRALESVAPADAVVWSGIMYADGCAADSLCTVLAFFCSDAHLVSWRQENHPDIDGYRLSMDEGLQAGRAIFAPMLAPPAETAAKGPA